MARGAGRTSRNPGSRRPASRAGSISTAACVCATRGGVRWGGDGGWLGERRHARAGSEEREERRGVETRERRDDRESRAPVAHDAGGEKRCPVLSAGLAIGRDAARPGGRARVRAPRAAGPREPRKGADRDARSRGDGRRVDPRRSLARGRRFGARDRVSSRLATSGDHFDLNRGSRRTRAQAGSRPATHPDDPSGAAPDRPPRTGRPLADRRDGRCSKTTRDARGARTSSLRALAKLSSLAREETKRQRGTGPFLLGSFLDGRSRIKRPVAIVVAGRPAPQTIAATSADRIDPSRPRAKSCDARSMPVTVSHAAAHFSRRAHPAAPNRPALAARPPRCVSSLPATRDPRIGRRRPRGSLPRGRRRKQAAVRHRTPASPRRRSPSAPRRLPPPPRAARRSFDPHGRLATDTSNPPPPAAREPRSSPSRIPTGPSTALSETKVTVSARGGEDVAVGMQDVRRQVLDDDERVQDRRHREAQQDDADRGPLLRESGHLRERRPRGLRGDLQERRHALPRQPPARQGRRLRAAVQDGAESLRLRRRRGVGDEGEHRGGPQEQAQLEGRRDRQRQGAQDRGVHAQGDVQQRLEGLRARPRREDREGGREPQGGVPPGRGVER